MERSKKLVDLGSSVTIAITLVLFAVALFLKGLTHDLILEGAVFLVSVKLILMGSSNKLSTESLHRELAEIKALLAASNNQTGR